MRDKQPSLDRPEHLGLAYERWAPHGTDNKKSERIDTWLERLETVSVSPEYRRYYQRWRDSFSPHAEFACVELRGRMLLGHGNPGGNEVGITVHHTWGVPMIPGSALKGLLAHRFDILYGPWGDQPAPDEAERAPWRGVRWKDDAIAHGPGECYRALFGAPDAADDDRLRSLGELAGASAGLVNFHDALYVPSSVPDDRPFARDVLTVHHKPYYDRQGGEWPNDWESPNPVGFIGVRAPARFLVVLTSRRGAADWAERAKEELLRALEEWGIGGKTSLGYGRFQRRDPADGESKAPESSSPSAARASLPPPERVKQRASPTFEAFEAFLKEKGKTNAEKFPLIEKNWPKELLSLEPVERRLAANRIERMQGKKGLPPGIEDLLRKLREFPESLS